MPDYTPPPRDLSHLNPLQRYMQKGSLDKEDYAWLVIFVLAYVACRPLISKFFAWFIAPKEIQEGEQTRLEYQQRRAKAKISPNAIREGKNTEPEDITIDEVDDTKTSGANLQNKGEVLNRKTKGKKGEKSEADKLLDWDDEPVHDAVHEEKTDVTAWLDKWDK